MRPPSPRSRSAGLCGLLAAALIVAALAAPARAASGETQAQAMEHFRQGRKLYQVSDYRAALEEFKRAFLLEEDPVFLFNIGQCHRQLGNGDEAITFYKRFLAASPQAANRAQVERLIRELQAATPGIANGPGEGRTEATTGARTLPAHLALPAPKPQPTPAPLNLAIEAPHRDADESRSVFGRWWFWTIVGAALVAGGTAVFVSQRQPADPGCPRGVNCD
jgi:tetratricopeptide (TPR) repeat protein